MVTFDKTAALRKILLPCLMVLLLQFAAAQKTTWQQELHYQLDVTLNDTLRTLDGFLILDYTNRSPDTLPYLWWHIWPNAYKNDRTAFSDQLLRNGNTSFYFSTPEERGYLNRLDVAVNGRPARIIDHPEHQDIVQVELPQPLAPQQTIRIKTPFHVQLPKQFSRLGYWEKGFYLSQWYPKPAVYDSAGWHPMPYLDQGEFYSEFANYHVQITVPKGYRIAAGGEWIDSLGGTPTTTTARYRLNQAHDFAWFADKDWVLAEDTLQRAGGLPTIHLKAYYLPKKESSWTDVINTMRQAIRQREALVGPYPYPIAIAVQGRKPGGGGMEYPGITLIDRNLEGRELHDVIAHELGHNWFYAALGSNERAYPWLDEGLNTYYDRRLSLPPVSNNSFLEKRLPISVPAYLLRGIEQLNLDQPIQTSSELFGPLQYGLVAYEKAADWLEQIEAHLGRNRFDSAMRTYYQQWAFRHPTPANFKAILEQIAQEPLDRFWTATTRTGPLVHSTRKRNIRLQTFFSARETNNYKYISVAPLVGYNQYDKLQVGMLWHNLQYPANGLQFVVAPFYATGSKALTGTATLQYHFIHPTQGRRVVAGLAMASFHGNAFTDSAQKTTPQRFQKMVPSLTWFFRQKPGSTKYGYVQAKTFLIREQGLRFTRDTINQQDVISFPSVNRYLNQLRVVMGNTRALYPWDAELQVEQGKQFVRLAFTGNYHFNYPKGGGLDLRFFAGKFFYTVDRTFQAQFETDPFHLNLTGPKGYEDYTYRNYYVGRSAFDGFASQQIMNRDGFFKVRTDLLSAKIGKTDNWLAALNLSSDIPKNINPLQVLPIKIPLRVFADIGTFAEAWNRNTGTPRFVYDAGFEIPLFQQAVRIFIPILYSKVYKDYFVSTITEKRFWRNISFSIDVHRLSLRKLIAPIPF